MLGRPPPSEAGPYVRRLHKMGSTRKTLLCFTICSKIMPEGSIVLYFQHDFQMRIFLVFRNVNMEGFKFKGFWHSGVSRGQNFLAFRRRSQFPNRSSL